MCGICGIYKRASTPELLASTHIMLNTMRCRGPDQQGTQAFDQCVVGVDRLSIIDIKGGDQPIHNEDGSLWIVYNGEIYNFKHLRKELLSKGHIFYTNTDTEVIIHLYEQYGEEGFERLNGMFAFAIFDKNAGKLVIARDRVGIKPLYYSASNGLVFASEMKALLSLKDRTYRLALSGVAQYLVYDYTPAPVTIVKDIFKLLPGAYLVKERDTVYEKPFAKVRITKDRRLKYDGQNENELTSQLGVILSDTIKDQMVADVPVGILLSGGIDSSTIAYFASEVKPDIHTFSIAFDEPSFDERKYAVYVAEKLKLRHHFEVFNFNAFKNIFQNITDFMDEPIADPSIIPTYFLSKFVSNYVKVVLSGEGGDEMFAGYPTYPAHRFASIYRMAPAFLRKRLIEPFIKLLPVSSKNFSLDFIIKRFVNAASLPLYKRHINWMGGFSGEELGLLFKPHIFHDVNDEVYQPVQAIISNLNALSESETANIIDLLMYLPDDLLAKIDRATMSASIESRVPLLDNRIVQFSRLLPYEYKIHGITQKYLLKRLMKHKLPDMIINRKKKGFGIPLTKWLQDEFRQETEALLSKDTIDEIGLFNYDFIKKLLKEHTERAFDHRKKLWPLIILVKWLQKNKIKL